MSIKQHGSLQLEVGNLTKAKRLNRIYPKMLRHPENVRPRKHSVTARFCVEWSLASRIASTKLPSIEILL